MHIHTRNVNTAFREFLDIFETGNYGHSHKPQHGGGLKDGVVQIVNKSSRNGNVMMIEEPVTITYSHPRERVLFNKARDANPFFHLYEALWMLAGRNDVASLAYYTSKMAQFSDDGKTFNGAYGYRWRHAYQSPQGTVSSWSNDEQRNVHYHHQDESEVDQLDILVNHLKADPNSRRAVLSMWNVEDDLLKVGCKRCTDHMKSGVLTFVPVKCSVCGDKHSTNGGSKDVCCNLNVMFSLRKGLCPPEQGCKDEVVGQCPANPYYLDMTVTNRSNDMILGMLGANYVHFTFLQEYMAARLGVEVGRYHHFTNNLHVYDWNWKPEEWSRNPIEGEVCYPPDFAKPYNMVPLVQDPAAFEKDLLSVVGNAYGGGFRSSCPSGKWNEPFFTGVAGPMFRAFESYKEKDYAQALRTCECIAADDWRIVATEWITRRIKTPA